MVDTHPGRADRRTRAGEPLSLSDQFAAQVAYQLPELP